MVVEKCEWGLDYVPFGTESGGERDIAVAVRLDTWSHNLVHTVPTCARGRCVAHYGGAGPVHGVD